MLSESDLLVLLSSCYVEYIPSNERIEEPSHFLNGMVAEVLKIQKNQELPCYESLNASDDIRFLFGRMLISANQVYKKNELMYQEISLELKELQLQIHAQSDVDVDQLCLLIHGMKNTRGSQFGDFCALKELMSKIENEITSEAITLIKTTSDALVERRLKALKNKIATHLIDRPYVDELIGLSLSIHSKKCTLERDSAVGSLSIIHFYGREQTIAMPHSGEHLNGFDSGDERDESISFDKTNHGLGSGVYGLAEMSAEEIADAVSKKRCYKIFDIRNPLRLDDSGEIKESDALTVLSKELQRICDEIKSSYYTRLRSLHLNLTGIRTKKESAELRRQAVIEFFREPSNEDKLHEQADILLAFREIKRKLLSHEDMYHILLTSTTEFFVGANRFEGSLIVMPINYVIKKLEFNGISSRFNDRFNRGLIAFETLTDSPLRHMGIKAASSPTFFRSSASADSFLSYSKGKCLEKAASKQTFTEEGAHARSNSV